MELVTLQEAQIVEVARQSWAADIDSQVAVAEVLRAELWARRVSTRRSLCQRVVDLMQPVRQIDLDSVTRILAELERSGDVTGGDHGRLAAAPLRAVDLGGGRYRLVGGPATTRLHQLLGQREVAGAFSRQVAVSEDSEAAFRQRLTTIGGLILTPEQWSGFDRTPPADKAWLAGLDDELRYNPGAPGALCRRDMTTGGVTHLTAARICNGCVGRNHRRMEPAACGGLGMIVGFVCTRGRPGMILGRVVICA